MNIGLYSELARQQHVKIREEIKRLGVRSNASAMRCFRDRLTKSDADHHRLIRESNDFYSLSMFRDLLFHIQEHRFTILGIKEALDKLGLKFCGFENPDIVSHFKVTNNCKEDPYDLNKWHFYEKANPRAFRGMYQFWCQKVN